MQTAPTVVLFDYGGVIAEEGFREGLKAIARLNGLEPETFYGAASRSIADCGYLTGRAGEAAFWGGLRRENALKQTDDELRREILGRFMLRPPMLAIAARLRAAGLKVGIISDQTDWLDELDRRDGFFACFDCIFNSYHEQASKYHGDLFSAVARQLHTAPAGILIIDDNTSNIDKAREHGFAAILFKDEKTLERQLADFFSGIFAK